MTKCQYCLSPFSYHVLSRFAPKSIRPGSWMRDGYSPDPAHLVIRQHGPCSVSRERNGKGKKINSERRTESEIPEQFSESRQTLNILSLKPFLSQYKTQYIGLIHNLNHSLSLILDSSISTPTLHSPTQSMRDDDQTDDDRLIFNVKLRPGETTIVSWKKLLRDAGRAGGSAPEPPANAHPSLESRFTSGQPAENEAKEAPAGPHRFSAVIEKIERLYMGKHSSDEEDLNDYPDDDQYDTEDSFIDDAELDEYFEVDKSEIKHDGFFVNRGKLESISEPTVSPNQQLKKRRRKDIAETHGEVGDDHIANKDAKLNKVAAGKTSLQKSDALSPSQSLTAKKEQFGGFKVQNQLNAPAVALKKKYTEAGISLGDSSSIKVSNGPSASRLEIKKIEKQKKGAIQSKSFSNKLKHGSGPPEGMNQKYLDKSVHSQPKSHSAKPLHNVNGVEAPVHIKEKYSNQEFPDNNVSKYPTHTTKTSHVHKKDGSSIKPKGSMLERAIRELERMVTESRPSSMENQEADVSSQAIKRRLPREIKLKLAKVARLAASHGKISEELINRLMSILGHLMQRRTLKRNLKVMISMGVSAKQEKDNRFQLMKNEVIEMIKLRPPTLESKASEQAGRSDDFQETGPEGKGVSKRKFSMDTALEDKICDLYDLYVDGLDDDAGQQIRKLYAELADLWPSGFMDNHGIKRAICRAKERRKALYSSQKDQEKVKKKMLVPKSDVVLQVEGSSAVQPQHARDPGSHGLLVATKAISSTSVSMPGSSTDGCPNMEKTKSSGNSAAEARVSEITTTKKVAKRKAEHEVMVQEEERHKSYKQVAGLAHKSNQQATAPS